MEDDNHDLPLSDYETSEEFRAELLRRARIVETCDVIRLDGLSDRQLLALMAAGRADETVGSFDVTGLSSEQFLLVLGAGDAVERTASELDEGRALLAERRSPPGL